MTQKTQKIQSLKGMPDILADDIGYWHTLEEVVRRTAEAYSYDEIRVPIMESTALFKRGIGDTTDIVEKEMYTFTDLSGDSVTLRPEATASVVRAGLQHGLFHNQRQRVWYMGPMFRHERPQRGRYRQFHQFGAEAFGFAQADCDAEIIALSRRILDGLDIGDLTLKLNSLGSPDCRVAYRDALKAYLQQHVDALDEDSQRRLERNPLRILDSKSEATQAVLRDAPQLGDYLDDPSRAHLDRLCDLLDDFGIEVTIDDRLVRGLDYYTSTVFEWTTDRLGAQSAVCGGGRYDTLVQNLGGKNPVPAAGFAMGLERLIELMKMDARNIQVKAPDIYTIGFDAACARVLAQSAETLRDAGFKVKSAPVDGSLKSKFKQADQSNAQIALVLGSDELERGVVQIKYLRDERDAHFVKIDHLEQHLIDELNA